MRTPLIALSLILSFAPARYGQAINQLSNVTKEFVSMADPVIALTHARVIDGTGAPAKGDQTIVISGGKIQSVGDSPGATIPAGARVVNLQGKSIIPGFVMLHEHMYYPAGKMVLFTELGFSFPRLYLACGITSIRTAGSVEPYTDLKLRKMIDGGAVPGPKMDVTGPYLDGAGTFVTQNHEIIDAEDARRMVEFWADQGATSFKAYMYLTRAELGAAIQTAHKRGRKLTGHLCSIGFREAAALGIDNLEHGIFVDTEFLPGKKPDVCPAQGDTISKLTQLDIASAPVQEMIRDLVAHHVAITSTLPVFEAFIPNRPPLQQRVLDAMTADARIQYLTTRARINGSKDSPWPVAFQKELEFERAFVKAGGLLLAGTDPTGNGAVLAGFGSEREIELLVEAGFTPIEAIHIGTMNGAEYMGKADRVGSIAPGKQADLLVIQGDPSTQVSDIEKIETVFKDGIGYDPGKLIESVRGSVGWR